MRGSRVTMDNIFQSTMSGLTAGLRVVHIAVLDLKTCDVNKELKQVIADPDLSGFDHVPVVSRSRIVGILEPREVGNEGSVKDKTRQLDDSMLVSADEPVHDWTPPKARPKSGKPLRNDRRRSSRC